MLARRPNPATAVALEESGIWLIPRTALEKIVLTHPALAMQIIENMADKIIELVAREWQTTVDALLGRDRSHKIAQPRQVAMYLLRKETDASLPQIGERLGGRDHTTVMYAIEKIANEIETKTDLRKRVVSIKQQLYGHAAVV